MEMDESQDGFQSISDDAESLIQLRGVQDDNFDAFSSSRRFRHFAQVLCFVLHVFLTLPALILDGANSNQIQVLQCTENGNNNVMQVVDETDKLEFADLNIFVPADTFKGSPAEKISKRTSFEVSLLHAVAEAAGNLKLPRAARMTCCHLLCSLCSSHLRLPIPLCYPQF